jgi:uracil phosphoribosyltransferase
MLFNLSEQNSIVNQFLFELRDKSIQQDRLRFRKNVERLGEIMAYEISKRFSYKSKIVQTSLGSSTIMVPIGQPVLMSIMRAGLPYFQGFLNVFDKADAGFIGAYRKEDGGDLTIALDYLACPSLQDRDLVLIDPMLATGKSIVDSLQTALKRGTPKHIYIASLIAAPEGINFLKQNLTVPYSLWTCAVDENLNEQFYIVPGLGDAGDLSYGPKI